MKQTNRQVVIIQNGGEQSAVPRLLSYQQCTFDDV